MKKTLAAPLNAGLLAILLATAAPAANAGVMRNYNEELGATVMQVRGGALKQAVAQIEKNNEGDDKDILYFLEKGELFSLGNNFATSRDTWLKGDETIQLWENEFRTNPSKLFGDIGSYLISDKTRRYDGQDYEKVMLSTRLTLNHILLGNFDSARIEMKKTYEREKLIEAFREKEYEALKAENAKEGNGEIQQLDGYPMEELDTPEVRELKNGFQNAFAHYLAGYFFEVTDETSLAEPGYRNALQLAPNKGMIQKALENVGREPLAPDQSDVLFIIETGFAPSIDSLNIPIPIPRRQGTIVTQLSFPVVKSSPRVLVPPTINVDQRALPVETLTNIDAMARRLIRDQMPGIILRTVIRAGFKSLVQDQAEKAHWLAGLVAKIVTVATEQADDRNWRTLPERISIARARLPHGRQRIEFQTNAGSYRTEVEVAGRFTIIPIRLTGGAVYVSQPQYSPQGENGLAEHTVQPYGSGLPEPVAATRQAAAPAQNIQVASSAPTLVASAPGPVATEGSAATRSIAPVALGGPGKRVTVGDTTYIGDFRFEQPSGLPVGQGRVEWSNGDSYEGTLLAGMRSGQGVFVSKSGGFRYEGEWQNNLQNGRGKTTFEDGDIYEGEMRDGAFHGQGTYLARNGSRYEGEWQRGVKEGHGKETFPDGDNWEGQFSNDQRTQLGQMNFIEKRIADAQDEIEPSQDRDVAAPPLDTPEKPGKP